MNNKKLIINDRQFYILSGFNEFVDEILFVEPSHDGLSISVMVVLGIPIQDIRKINLESKKYKVLNIDDLTQEEIKEIYLYEGFYKAVEEFSIKEFSEARYLVGNYFERFSRELYFVD